MIGVIDVGLGNIGSVCSMLNHIGVPNKILNNSDQIIDCKKLILPGVGSFDTGIRRLNDSGFSNILRKIHYEKSHDILGICLGAQLLGYSSDEGFSEGLKCLNFKTIDFRSSIQLRTPHMGWNTINFNNINTKLSFIKEFNFDDLDRFYFVHRYFMKVNNCKIAYATTHYGKPFTSIVGEYRTVGVQFHPEKSSISGIKFLRAFASYVP